MRNILKYKTMKARLAKKIIKASPLYQWYCKEFNKKPSSNKYWLQKMGDTTSCSYLSPESKV